MENLLTTGLPQFFFVLPCVMIYIKLMRFIRNRPSVNGIDITKEKVHIYEKSLKNMSIIHFYSY